MAKINWLQKAVSFMGKKSMSFFQTTDYDLLEIENIETYFKLVSRISAIPKSIQEISSLIYSQEYIIRDKKSEKELEKIPDKVKLLIDNPHPEYNFAEFIQLVITDLLVAGNIFVYITQTQDRAVLRRLDPRYVNYDNGHWEENHPNGQRQILNDRFLIHIKFQPDFYRPVWGRGIIANNQTMFKNLDRMLEFREKFYENGCHPTGIVSVEQSGGALGEKALKAEFDAKHKGTKNTGKPIILSGKVTYQQIQLDPTALKISEELILLSKEVMSAFGLPKYLMELGLKDSGGQKFNNHNLQHEHYLKSTIIPISKKIAGIFNNVLERLNPNWELVFKIRAEVYDEKVIQAMTDAGTLTPNEQRELLALPEAEDKNLDNHFMSGNKKLLEDVVAGEPEPEPVAPGVVPPASGNPQEDIPPDKKPPNGKPVPEEPKKPEPVKPKPKKKIDNGLRRERTWRDSVYLSQPENEVWTNEELKAELTAKRVRHDFVATNKKTRVKKAKENALKTNLYLVDLYSNIIANLAKQADDLDALAKPAKAQRELTSIVGAVYNEAGDLVKLEKITGQIYQSVGAATYGNTSGVLTVDVPFLISDPGVAAVVAVMRKQGPLVTQTTKGKLTEVITQGIAEGKTHNLIAKDIYNRFVTEDGTMSKEFSKIYRKGVKPQDFDKVMTRGDKLVNRALLIARNEVAVANKRFAIQSMKTSNVVKSITITDCDPCPICAPYQNVPVSFAEAGTIENIHVNCTGTIVPGEIGD